MKSYIIGVLEGHIAALAELQIGCDESIPSATAREECGFAIREMRSSLSRLIDDIKTGAAGAEETTHA